MVFKFVYAPWDVAADTWYSYKGDVTKVFAAKLEQYKGRMLKAGMQETKAFEIRNHIHFTLLVEHQVNKLKYQEIARKHGSSTYSDRYVSEAITSLAKFIGLSLRPAHGRTNKRKRTG